MKTWQVPPVNQKIRREPKGYYAKQYGVIIAENNSIALLRHNCKGLKGVTFHTIR